MNKYNIVESIGKYNVVKSLGRGDSGTVFLCEEIGTNKRYAIKEISLRELEEEDINEIKNETEIFKKINLPKSSINKIFTKKAVKLVCI